MVPQAGLDTRVWRDVTALGRTLQELPAMAPDSHARVAVVLDWESWWATSNGAQPVAFGYDEIVKRWYSALHRLHFSIDIVHPTSPLTQYDLVVAPTLYLLDERGADNLTGFVRNGGHLLVTAFSDVVDGNEAFLDGGFLTRLRDVLGVWVEEFGALVPPTAALTSKSAGAGEGDAASSGPGQRDAPYEWAGGTGIGQYFAEEIHAAGAEVLGSFTGGRQAGRPALTRNSYGEGIGYYLATIPDDAGMKALLADLAGTAGAQPEIREGSEWIEVARRGDTLTVINHGERREEVSVPDAEGTGAIALEAREWRMLRSAVQAREGGREGRLLGPGIGRKR